MWARRPSANHSGGQAERRFKIYLFANGAPSPIYCAQGGPPPAHLLFGPPRASAPTIKFPGYRAARGCVVGSLFNGPPRRRPLHHRA